MSDRDTRRKLIADTWAAAWDRGDVDALDAVLKPEYRRRAHAGDQGQDLAAFKASITAARAAFPDLTTTIDEILVEGDSAAVRWHSTGRHDGPFLGVPPTHRQVEVSGATFARFDGDRVVEEFVTWDPRALLSALGVISVGQDA
jgi:steroid delta-isomerase-like uncharacterized protein